MYHWDVADGCNGHMQSSQRLLVQNQEEAGLNMHAKSRAYGNKARIKERRKKKNLNLPIKLLFWFIQQTIYLRMEISLQKSCVFSKLRSCSSMTLMATSVPLHMPRNTSPKDPEVNRPKLQDICLIPSLWILGNIHKLNTIWFCHMNQGESKRGRLLIFMKGTVHLKIKKWHTNWTK